MWAWAYEPEASPQIHVEAGVFCTEARSSVLAPLPNIISARKDSGGPVRAERTWE